MKAVIPVAGVGTRLRPHTYTHPKPLIPVAGKPILSYIIDNLLTSGIRDFVFIVGYLGDKIVDFVKEKYPEINAEFVVQSNREGLGHAIYTAREVINNAPMLVMLGDTIIDADITEIIESETSAIGIKKVNDPRNFGVAKLDDTNFVTELIEKPRIPKSNLALVGIYKIVETEKLMSSLEHIIAKNIRTNNEFHLTDALEFMLNKYETKIKALTINNWFDLGKRDILLETNAVLLKKNNYPKESRSFTNTIIIAPVHIAENVEIKNSIIGPNVTIGENAKVEYSVLTDSIIGNFTQLENVHLNYSIIGNDAVIKGNSQSLNIGDNTEIDLSGQSN
ncbi:MAG: sugar phosphate nucleotidyltransferase [Chitinophagales bacterium]